jgi:hypothetical protein
MSGICKDSRVPNFKENRAFKAITIKNGVASHYNNNLHSGKEEEKKNKVQKKIIKV